VSRVFPLQLHAKIPRNRFTIESGKVNGSADGSLPEPCRELHLLEQRLVESHTTVIIPFEDRVIVVRLLNGAQFSSRLSEVAQTLDAISRIQFLIWGRGLGERCPSLRQTKSRPQFPAASVGLVAYAF
jgi:hypothetical protein